jgi:glycosyltransferase involved in cell wall biosynthesis
MKVPTVDVIVPCYNYGHLLADCVASVLHQRNVSARVLIMDDCSLDETQMVGMRLSRHPRVEYRRHEINRGHIATYNEALELVDADYCVLLSADDMLTPGSLARATRVMEDDPRVGVVFGRDITFRDRIPTQPVRTGTGAPKLYEYAHFLERACGLGHTGVQAPTVVVRTSVHHEIGNYLPELPHSGDTEIWLRMAAAALVAELDADQAYRRLHTGNMSLGYKPLDRLREQLRAFDVHFETAAMPSDLKPLRAVAHRSIAESALWTAAQAFDAGDVAVCDAAIGFALAASPDIKTWPPYRRLVWKRRLGASAWRMLGPIVSNARRRAQDIGLGAAR